MVNFTLAEYMTHEAKMERGRRKHPVIPYAVEPFTNEKGLQQQIEDYCLSKGWMVLRSRMDKRTTVPVSINGLDFYKRRFVKRLHEKPERSL